MSDVKQTEINTNEYNPRLSEKKYDSEENQINEEPLRPQISEKQGHISETLKSQEGPSRLAEDNYKERKPEYNQPIDKEILNHRPVYFAEQKNPLKEQIKEPKLTVYRGDYEYDKEESMPKTVQKTKKESSDDEEVSTVSGPKRNMNKDDLVGYIPIVQIKEPSQPKKIVNKNDLKPVQSEEIKEKPFNDIKKEDIVFKQSGILDIINEMNNLGLDEVEIKPLRKSKTNNMNKGVAELKENTSTNG